MLPQRSTRHRGRRERRQQRQAAWMFLIASVVVFLLITFWGPQDVSPGQHRALGIAYSVFVGFFAFFLTGSTKAVAESDRSGWTKVGICLVAAAIAAVAVYGVWVLGLSPVSTGVSP